MRRIARFARDPLEESLTTKKRCIRKLEKYGFQSPLLSWEKGI